MLIPIETAPKVLTVNSDFDEGRIDPATGYAIPDCDDMAGVDQKTGAGNTSMALEAHRAHLDGTYAQYERVTDDMHAGWFGVHPDELLPEIWDDAIVTVRKVDKIDADTGYPESGQVRFYRKWGTAESQYRGIETYNFANLNLAPKDLVTGGINKAPLESVYGSTANPNGGQFYMEGVRPGKITLEWRLQIGEADVKYEQTFLVATQQSVEDWREEIRYQIRLQTIDKVGGEVDTDDYDPSNGFMHPNFALSNHVRVQEMYYYYRQLFLQRPEELMWMGTAKTVVAPIYAAMSDMREWKDAQEWLGLGSPDGGAGTKRFINEFLLEGQIVIFDDLAWPHRAYVASGIEALKYLKKEEETEQNKSTDYVAWEAIDKGIWMNDLDSLFEGTVLLAKREQRDVIQDRHDILDTLELYQPPLSRYFGAVEIPTNPNGLVHAGKWLSANSTKSPIPGEGAPAFQAMVPGGRIDHYIDRWAWTDDTNSGILQMWAGKAIGSGVPNYTAEKRLHEVSKSLFSAAFPYSLDPGGLPEG